MRDDFLVSLLKIVAVIALAVAVVNDVGNILTGLYQADAEVQQVAWDALRAYKQKRSVATALKSAQARAAGSGATVTGFEITADAVRVAVSFPPRNTWWAHRLQFLRQYVIPRAQFDLPLNSY